MLLLGKKSTQNSNENYNDNIHPNHFYRYQRL